MIQSIVPSNTIVQPHYEDIGFLNRHKVSLYNILWKTILFSKPITIQDRENITHKFDIIIKNLTELQSIYESFISIEDIERKYTTIWAYYSRILSEISHIIHIITPIINDKERIKYCNEIYKFPITLNRALREYITPEYLDLLFEFDSKYGKILNWHGTINNVMIKYDPENLCTWCHNNIHSIVWHDCYRTISFNKLWDYWIDIDHIIKEFKDKQTNYINHTIEQLSNKLWPYIL